MIAWLSTLGMAAVWALNAIVFWGIVIAATTDDAREFTRKDRGGLLFFGILALLNTLCFVGRVIWWVYA